MKSSVLDPCLWQHDRVVVAACGTECALAPVATSNGSTKIKNDLTAVVKNEQCPRQIINWYTEPESCSQAKMCVHSKAVWQYAHTIQLRRATSSCNYCLHTVPLVTPGIACAGCPCGLLMTTGPRFPPGLAPPCLPCGGGAPIPLGPYWSPPVTWGNGKAEMRVRC